MNLQVVSNLASSCQAGNVSSNSLLGYQLKVRLGRRDLWKQVQISHLSVDITKVGALINARCTYSGPEQLGQAQLALIIGNF